MKVSEKERKLVIWDTAGQNDLAQLRKLAYPSTHVFIVCFSLADKETYQAVTEYWLEELREHGPSNVPKILVGTKLDLRNDYLNGADQEKKDKCVTSEMGKKLKNDGNFFAYYEVSAFKRIKLAETFFKAVKVADANKPATPS